VHTHASVGHGYAPPVAPKPDDPVALWRSLGVVHASVARTADEALVAADRIPLAWFEILDDLDGAPERALRMSQLADRHRLSRSRVSRLVDDLEASGLVERYVDPVDGRALLATITRDGRRELKRAIPVVQRSVRATFAAHLSDTERRSLSRAVQRVLDAER
jgi:DNA-binding MarR family transcriptional regulator